MNDNETEQFDLNLYIDGTGYQLCLDKGNIPKATASISGKVLLLQICTLLVRQQVTCNLIWKTSWYMYSNIRCCMCYSGVIIYDTTVI